jgi:hypothetical protein
MRFLTAAATAAVVCATAFAASAEPAHLNDVQFIAANRCLGLMGAKATDPDAATLGRLVQAESAGRTGFVYDRADQAREDGRRDAGRTGAYMTAKVAEERDGLCHAFVDRAATTAAAAHTAHAS